ncbi:flagellar basal body rod C-terminal domain-containing protein, partial [Clostridium sp.]|uniref:flagellar basal body rod C-terminal domain-containing protein n=1 Tax=Clostridium sp. TaxID=1506 RepID=UPI0026085796
FGPGSQLNGYKVVLGAIGPNTVTSANVNKNEKTIVLNGDFSTGGTLTPAQAESAVNKALSSAGISQSISVSGKAINYSNLGSEVVLGGVEATAPGTVTVAGLTVQFSAGSGLNDYIIKTDNDPMAATASATFNNVANPKEIVVKGNYAKLSATEVQDAINAAIKKEGINQEVKVLGSVSSSFTVDVASDTITGGTAIKAPTNKISVAGIDLVLDPGASLNGYKFVVGTISKGTLTEASIDTETKTITINGDFVSGKMIPKDVTDGINKVLASKGISQKVSLNAIPGTLMKLDESSVVSGETIGGTPVESINGDGSIVFVDATKDLKSYDGSLKTLKIPEKVRMPGSNQELRIKTYTIDANGIINGVLEDGRVAALGQIAMASFKNSEGLTKAGGNLYNSSVNSGTAVIKSGVGTVDDDNSKGYGDTIQGMLEMSNVDLAEQFTDMIVASRAFQAAGKMITTGDEILQDIINLKR